MLQIHWLSLHFHWHRSCEKSNTAIMTQPREKRPKTASSVLPHPAQHLSLSCVSRNSRGIRAVFRSVMLSMHYRNQFFSACLPRCPSDVSDGCLSKDGCVAYLRAAGRNSPTKAKEATSLGQVGPAASRPHLSIHCERTSLPHLSVVQFQYTTVSPVLISLWRSSQPRMSSVRVGRTFRV